MWNRNFRSDYNNDIDRKKQNIKGDQPELEDTATVKLASRNFWTNQKQERNETNFSYKTQDKNSVLELNQTECPSLELIIKIYVKKHQRFLFACLLNFIKRWTLNKFEKVWTELRIRFKTFQGFASERKLKTFQALEICKIDKLLFLLAFFSVSNVCLSFFIAISFSYTHFFKFIGEHSKSNNVKAVQRRKK